MYRLILSCMFLFLSVSPVYFQGFLLDKGQSAWFWVLRIKTTTPRILLVEA